MKKEDFISLGISEELAEKAAEASAKELEGFIPKSRFEEVNEAKKQLEKDVKTRDGQLEELKKANGNNEELQKQIKELQETNKTEKAKYESDIKDLRLSNAIKLSLAGKVHDEEIVAGLFDKTKLVLGEDGKVLGLEEQIKELQETKKFLFKQVNGGYNPQGGSHTVTNPFAKETFNLTEQGKLLKENPAQARELAAAAGMTI
ncbi:phage scaffolding protein [Acetivibrio ethanolgignens]|uniref:Phage minor structural protein GP20 n=1 Tax=Acetivibrio ethanolgignens TaxID=290052 RepID=A0A0V8QJL6_9FIRM|nr:phage scaffolding protein [Acetivibrio ethanolgignens]KSV60297.1 hypothetical protein ASU35_05975 [Acetivibrio ethanolgignens]